MTVEENLLMGGYIKDKTELYLITKKQKRFWKNMKD